MYRRNTVNIRRARVAKVVNTSPHNYYWIAYITTFPYFNGAIAA